MNEDSSKSSSKSRRSNFYGLSDNLQALNQPQIADAASSEFDNAKSKG